VNDDAGTVAGKDQSHLQETSSNEDIMELWLNFYNECYWYCYQQFVGLMGGAGQQQTENLLEDFVTEKTAVCKVKEKPKKETKLNSVPRNSETVEQQNIGDNYDTQVAITNEPDVVDDSKTDRQLQSQEVTDSQLEKDKQDKDQSHNQDALTDSQPSQQPPQLKNNEEDAKKPEQDKKPDNQVAPPADKKDTQRALKISSKAIQYTSIVWTLQEAGIIPSVDDQGATTLNGDKKCTDHVHCNGSSDTDEKSKDKSSSSVGNKPSTSANTQASPEANPDDRLLEQSLKRKR